MTWTATLLYLILPGGLLFLQDRVTLIRWLSPAFWAYLLGIILRWILPFDDAWGAENMEIYVALAIPILLLSANLRQWLRLAPQTARAYGLYLLSVLIAVGLSIWWWQDRLADAALRGAMATGVYTGGTANMAAIQVALEGPAALFVELNFTDLVLCGLLLLLILSVLPRFLRVFLPPFPYGKLTGPSSENAPSPKVLSLRRSLPGVGGSLLGGAVILGLSFGISHALLGQANGTLIVVLLSVLGLAASLIPRVRNWPMSYETGDYLFLAFCVAAGAQINVPDLVHHDWGSVGFLISAFVGILGVFFLLAGLFRVDRDTALICLVAGLFGPPFIGPVAQKLENREIVVTGMTLGVLGLAIGNFMGLMVFAWLGP